MNTPEPVESLAQNFESAFTKPSLNRIVILVMAAVLTTGPRTVSNILRTVGFFSFGHASSFHRLLSKRRWKPWLLSKLLMSLILRTFCRDGVICLVGDDTVDGHKGKNVFGKGCHRDAVRSTHSHLVFRWGHKWVVLSILVRLPLTKRPWALPCLIALYRSKKDNEKNHRRHKTPAELMRQMLLQVLRWFPNRKFQFCADQGYAKHKLVRLAVDYRDQITIVSRFYANANLYLPPPPRGLGAGRPRVKGAKLPSPKKIVDRRQNRQNLHVQWYGGGERDVDVISEVGHWYKGGDGLIPVRWVNVQDRTGTHREEYFFSTDPLMSPSEIIESYTGRWPQEVTFQEVRSYTGVETTRGWSEKTVLRMAPLLFALYSIVVLIYERLPKIWQDEIWVNWQGKEHLCFSDVITTVRCYLWQEWIFANLPAYGPVAKLPRKLRLPLLHALAPAS